MLFPRAWGCDYLCCRLSGPHLLVEKVVVCQDVLKPSGAGLPRLVPWTSSQGLQWGFEIIPPFY